MNTIQRIIRWFAHRCGLFVVKREQFYLWCDENSHLFEKSHCNADVFALTKVQARIDLMKDVMQTNFPSLFVIGGTEQGVGEQRHGG